MFKLLTMKPGHISAIIIVTITIVGVIIIVLRFIARHHRNK